MQFERPEHIREVCLNCSTDKTGGSVNEDTEKSTTERYVKGNYTILEELISHKRWGFNHNERHPQRI